MHIYNLKISKFFLDLNFGRFYNVIATFLKCRVLLMRYIKDKKNRVKGYQLREKCASYLTKIPKAIIQQKAKKLAKKSPLYYVPGENFGERFQIVKKIKKDKMGRVYKAKDKELDKVVFLRIFNPELSAHKWTDIVEKCKRKLPMAKYIDSENLGKLYDIGTVEKIKFITIRDAEREGLQEFKELIIYFSAALIILVGLALFFAIGKRTPEALAIVKPMKKSIAILPFKDLSPAKDQEHFCDGMTDAMIDKFCQLEGLKVISINSVMRYKNTKKSIKEIGKELDVDTILASNIYKEKDRIRVNIKLINVEDGYYIWSDKYDREIGSVFEVQDDISKAIANALKVELLPDAFQTAKAKEPKNVEAWEYYLKGMYFIDKKYDISGEEQDFETALRMFEKAIGIDQNYALAYFGLGNAYESHFVKTKNKKDNSLMLKNFERAHNLNPNLAEANAAMGWMHFYRADNVKAYQSFKRALEIEPKKPLTNFHIGSFLGSIGLYRQAIEYYSRSLEHDPLYTWNHILLARALINIKEFEKAAIYIKKGLEIEPDNFFLNLIYVKRSILMEKYEEAEKALARTEEILPDSPRIRLYRAWLLAAKGEKEKALTLIKDEALYSYEVTSIYSLLGMKDEAIKHINEGINNGFQHKMFYLYSYPFLINNPYYANLQDDARFKEIVKKEKKKYKEKLRKYGRL